MTQDLPRSLRLGLRATIVDGVTIGGILRVEDRWAIQATIDFGKSEGSSERVPARSEWYVVVDADYPFGDVRVYPSKCSGIIDTFQHQLLNLPGSDNLPWRAGKLCLDRPTRRLNLTTPSDDPVGNREERLRWHLVRAVEWLKAARMGDLIQDGDPFELPSYPTRGDFQVVHDESAASYCSWEVDGSESWGHVVLEALDESGKTVLAVAFTAPDGRQIVRRTQRYSEEQHGPGCDDRRLGVWWLWPAPIILDPWQVPLDWADLRAVATSLGFDADLHLRQISRSIRGQKISVLLFGYPIPMRQGERPCEVHWQAISLPALSKGGKVPKGFRTNDQGWWQRDRASTFDGEQKLNYLRTANWHPDRLQARGRYGSYLTERSIAIIGCGALGSQLAELLVRGGVRDVLLVDHDTLVVGNLVRHTLSGYDVGKNKATALTTMLRSVAPFASVCSHEGRLPTNQDDLQRLLESRDIVIDCTGSDEVLMTLSLGWWALPKLFVSASVGHEAKRVFIFSHRGFSFPYPEFRRAVDPCIASERGRWAEHGEVLEGPGCWSPLFPARMDDLMLAAASCGKVLEELADESSVEGRLTIFEQDGENLFSGFRRVDSQRVTPDE